MKKIIIFPYIILCILFSSCSSTYYYATLQTTDPELKKQEQGDFVYENDSLWIAYSFEGEDAPIKISVFNKLEIPMYVDWGRSALIINNTAYSYDDGVVRHFSESESTSYDSWFGITKTYTNTVGESQLPKSISFIPPQSKIDHQTLRLSAKFDKIDMKDYEKTLLSDKKLAS